MRLLERTRKVPDTLSSLGVRETFGRGGAQSGNRATRRVCRSGCFGLCPLRLPAVARLRVPPQRPVELLQPEPEPVGPGQPDEHAVPLRPLQHADQHPAQELAEVAARRQLPDLAVLPADLDGQLLVALPGRYPNDDA